MEGPSSSLSHNDSFLLACPRQPAVCPSNPSNEWCPSGHGDLYAALVGSGRLDELLAAGFKYMFVSNSDNLGASLDMKLLTYFAQKDAPFLMECCERTVNVPKRQEGRSLGITVFGQTAYSPRIGHVRGRGRRQLQRHHEAQILQHE